MWFVLTRSIFSGLVTYNDPRTHLIRVKVAARVTAICCLHYKFTCYILLNNARWQNFHEINFCSSSTNHEIREIDIPWKFMGINFRVYSIQFVCTLPLHAILWTGYVEILNSFYLHLSLKAEACLYNSVESRPHWCCDYQVGSTERKYTVLWSYQKLIVLDAQCWMLSAGCSVLSFNTSFFSWIFGRMILSKYFFIVCSLD